MSKGIAQLGPKGYIRKDTETSDVIQLIFSHMFECDHSQSKIFLGKVTSIQWEIKELNHVPEELAFALKEKVKAVYKKFFNDVTVECSTVNENGDQYNINLYVSVEENGKTFELGRELAINVEEGTGKVIASINR